MRLIIALGIVSLLAVSCKDGSRGYKSEMVVVQVDGNVLTREMLNENIPQGMNAEDSIIASEHFIHTWIIDQLMYDKAKSNIADEETIGQLVENYRKSLIIYQYQENLINEKLSRNIDQEKMLNYYNAHVDRFRLDRPLVKGLFLKIPNHVPNIDKLRLWCEAFTPASLSNIEKYCIRHALAYNYVVDNWVDFNEISLDWPASGAASDATKAIANKKFIEEKDNKYHYFLYVTDYLLPGDNAPFEYAQSTVREILINQKKLDFIKTMESQLYDNALSSGKIKFYSN